MALPRHQKRGGESPPPSSSPLISSLDGRRVSPLVLGLHGMGGGESPSEIGSVSLCFCVLVAALSPFRVYMEIRHSDRIETFAVIFFYRKLDFLRPKKGINRLTGGPRGSGARPGGQARPCLVATSGTVSRGFFFRNSPNIPKIFSVRFYPVWILFDMDIL